MPRVCSVEPPLAYVTVNEAAALNPLTRPFARTVWAPGVAPAGIVTALVKLPYSSVVAVPRDDVPVVESTNDSRTRSKAPKSLPVTVTPVPGGPEDGATPTAV